MMCAHRSLSALVWALAVAHLALISTTALDLTPAQQVFESPHDDQLSAFSPLLPPAIPLAVKSPYLNAWLPHDVSNGSLAGDGAHARFWPVSYPPPGSNKGYSLGWTGYVRVGHERFIWMGDTSEPPSNSDVSEGKRRQQLARAQQTHFEYTATRTRFSFEASGVRFNATFMSPTLPRNLHALSLPYSYLAISFDNATLLSKKDAVAVYTDIDARWASGDGNVNVTWSFAAGEGVAVHRVRRAQPREFAEAGEQAEWGEAVYATSMGPNIHTASGSAHTVRSLFLDTGGLDGRQDVNYRSVSDDMPVFAFAADASSSDDIVFAIGHVRDPYVQYVTREGMVPLSPIYGRGGVVGLSSQVLELYPRLRMECSAFDRLLHDEASRVGGQKYAAIVALSARQALATFELARPPAFANTHEPWAFLKEISSNGDMSTIDVIFPLYPLLAYTNPRLLHSLLEPYMRYTASGLWPHDWPVHDIGRYPTAFGHNDGGGEAMPVETAGDLLWMLLAYLQLTGDKDWIASYYPLLKQWTGYLISDGLVPAEQLSTDDFAGTLSNQTNLAVKAIVGIGAMGEIAQQLGHFTDHVHYRATAHAYARVWTSLALTHTNVTGTGKQPHQMRHAKLAYQQEDSWGLLYNLWGDRVLGLGLWPRDLYEDQDAWYATHRERYGVPLDSRHKWTKTDWLCFSAAMATTRKGRDLFIDSLYNYLQAGKVNAGFPDLYETTTGSFPGREGLDFPLEFIARPVVGAHFAPLLQDAVDRRPGRST